jgi:hypothetical protein
MICFRDMTFCQAACLNASCHRRFTPEIRAAADRWWKEPGAPIAFSDFSPTCRDYAPEGGADQAARVEEVR